MSKTKEYKGRFPEELGGLPDDIKMRLIQTAMCLAIEERQEAIIKNEQEMLYDLDTVYPDVTVLKDLDRASNEEVISEARQAIAYYKEVYNNADSFIRKRQREDMTEFIKSQRLHES